MARWLVVLALVGCVGCSLLFNGDDLRHVLDLSAEPDQAVLADGAVSTDGAPPPDLAGADLVSIKLTNFSLSKQTPLLGASIDAVSLTDLDGDQHPELILASGSAHHLYLLKGLTSGTYFDGPMVGPTICPGGPGISSTFAAFTVSDLDGSAPNDVAVLCADGANPGEVELFYGNGTVGFSVPTAPATLTSPANVNAGAIAAGDADGDGNVDLLVTNYDNATVSWYGGVGARQYNGPQEKTTGGNPLAVAVGSITSDPAQEVVIAQKMSSAGPFPVGATVFYNTLASVFASAQAGGIPFAAPIALRLAQLDGANAIDLAILGPSSVGVFLTDGTNRLPTTASTSVSIGSGTNADLAFADLDNDGLADLVVTESGTGKFWVALATAPGAYGAPVSFDFGLPASGTPRVQVGDLNGDKLPDVVIALSDGNIVVFLNTST